MLESIPQAKTSSIMQKRVSNLTEKIEEEPDNVDAKIQTVNLDDNESKNSQNGQDRYEEGSEIRLTPPAKDLLVNFKNPLIEKQQLLVPYKKTQQKSE